MCLSSPPFYDVQSSSDYQERMTIVTKLRVQNTIRLKMRLETPVNVRRVMINSHSTSLLIKKTNYQSIEHYECKYESFKNKLPKLANQFCLKGLHQTRKLL